MKIGSNVQATATFDAEVAPPVLKARIDKVTVSGPAKVKKGKKAVYKVKVKNSGNSVAKGVKLKVSGKGVKAKNSMGDIPAGRSNTAKLKLKLKKPGKIKTSFTVTSSNAGGKTVMKKIKVKK